MCHTLYLFLRGGDTNMHIVEITYAFMQFKKGGKGVHVRPSRYPIDTTSCIGFIVWKSAKLSHVFLC